MRVAPKVKCARVQSSASRAHTHGLVCASVRICAVAHYPTEANERRRPLGTAHQRILPQNPRALCGRHILARNGGIRTVCVSATGERLRRGIVDRASTLCASRWGKGTLSL
jgi:hypothetical protein